MPRSRNEDPEFLSAALIGLQHTLNALEERISDLRSQLAGHPASPTLAPAVVEAGTAKRTLSAAARRRIALAQKKRWAAFNEAKRKSAGKPAAAKKAAGKPAPKPAKRVMSAAGRARIVAAAKKRWAAFHKAQKPAKPAAKAPAEVAPVAAAVAAPAAE